MSFPYSDQFPIHAHLPETGVPRETVLATLRAMSEAEEAVWIEGGCSGTMYAGDPAHYDFLNSAFSYFSSTNTLQRDMCPSATKMEAEVIAMTLGLLHGEHREHPAGLFTSGGTSSIAHAILAYKETFRGEGRPNIVKPETAHAAFAKACHLFDVEMRIAPCDPVTMTVDLAAVASLIDENTVALVGSATNYGFGTIDDIAGLGQLALQHNIGLHVDACLGGFILAFAEGAGVEIPAWDFRVPGVTTISIDTHKYGYALKGTSVLCFADKELRNSLYFFQTGWSGGKYCSPGMDGSRSGGLLAATWAAMVSLGREGYQHYATKIFETSAAMQAAVREHPSLRLIGQPTYLFSFTSDDYDIYLVNDYLRTVGWRLNGQQYPDAIHMAVTRPQTQPGVVERWRRDLAAAVDYATAHAGERASSGVIYGGVLGGLTDEADDFITMLMADMMDQQMEIRS